MLKLAVKNEFQDVDLVKGFTRELLLRQGLKKNTRYNHEKIVQKALRTFGTQQPSREQVEDYIAAMYEAEPPYSYAHIVNTIRSLVRYMSYLGDPIEIGYPKKPKNTIKDPMTEGEVAVIIAATKNIREKAILTLLAYSGVRNEELCSVKVKDIDFGDNRLHVHLGKGSKDRNIPIRGECTKVLLQYLSEFPRQDENYLFTTLYGNRRYKPHALRQLVNTVVDRTNIEKDIWPHLFRHSLATNMIARGASPLTVQKQLGHAYIETTMGYVHSNDQRHASEYNVYAPSYT